MAQFSGKKDERGRAAVVRNGYLPEREVLTGIGPIKVKVPRLRSRTKERVVLRSSPVASLRTPVSQSGCGAALVFLKGISTRQMGESLEVLVGPDAKGLSSSVVSRLKEAMARGV